MNKFLVTSDVVDDYKNYVGTKSKDGDKSSRKFIKVFNSSLKYSDLSFGAIIVYSIIWNKVYLYKRNKDASLVKYNSSNKKYIEEVEKIKKSNDGVPKFKDVKNIMIEDITMVGDGELYNYPISMGDEVFEKEIPWISDRTIFRYLKELEDAGFIERKDKNGRRNGREIRLVKDLSKPTKEEKEGVKEFCKEWEIDMEGWNEIEVKEWSGKDGNGKRSEGKDGKKVEGKKEVKERSKKREVEGDEFEGIEF